MSAVPQFVLFATIGILITLLLISFQQLCRSSVNQMNIIYLRICIIISLTLEIGLIVIQYYVKITVSESISHIMYWSVLLSICFIIFKLVHSPRFYQQMKLARLLHRLWICISVTHILWLLFCVISFIITKQISIENIYLFGLHIYTIFASIIVLLISFHSYSTINGTIYELNKSSSVHFHDYIYKESELESNHNKQIDVDISTTINMSVDISMTIPNNKVTTEQLVDPMVTILHLSKAKYIITIHVCIFILLIISSLIALYWVSFQFKWNKLSSIFYLQQIDLFIFHFWFSFIFYITPLINHWIWSKSITNKQYSVCDKFIQYITCNLCHDCCYNNDINNTAHIINLSNKKHKPTKTIPKNILQTKNQSEENAIEIAIDNINIKSNVDLKRTTNTPISEDLNLDSEDLFVSNTHNHSTIIPQITPKTLNLDGHSALISYTEEYSNKNKMQLNVSLNKINSSGQIIGKKGLPKTNRLRKTDIELEVIDDKNTIIEEHKKDKKHFKTETLKMNANKKPIINKMKRQITELKPETVANSQELLDEMLDTMSLTPIGSKPITTFVFEFDKILCTNINKLHNKFETSINNMTLLQKQLCFGGIDRIKSIANFFKTLYQYNDDNQNEILNVKCFVLSNESTKM
eukprot:19187_1